MILFNNTRRGESDICFDFIYTCTFIEKKWWKFKRIHSYLWFKILQRYMLVKKNPNSFNSKSLKNVFKCKSCCWQSCFWRESAAVRVRSGLYNMVLPVTWRSTSGLPGQRQTYVVKVKSEFIICNLFYGATVGANVVHNYMNGNPT